MEAPPTPWALVHRNARGEHELFELADRPLTVLGRGAESDLALMDQRVSRRHASIELVEDQFLLRDEGSSNGTFLNGFRMTAGRVFVLREGDVIEIGDELLVFGRKGEVSTPSSNLSSTALSYPLADLVRDGYASLEDAERSAIEDAVFAAFDARGRLPGLEKAASFVAERLRLSTAAIFTEDARHGVRPIAAWPKLERAGSFLPLAAKARETREGHLVRGAGVLESTSFGSTDVHSVQSIAAAPFGREGSLSGVLAAGRSGERPLDRSDLSWLAVLGDRIALALAAQARDDGDTRVGFQL